MLNSALVVLRELLEVLLLITILIVIVPYSKSRLIRANATVFIGISLAFLLSIFMPNISDSFNGLGQEILISTFLFTISVFLLTNNFYHIQHAYAPTSPNTYASLATLSIYGAIMLAISLEGAEIFIYFSGIIHSSQPILPNLFGALLGGGIAVSFNIIVYYWLKSSRHTRLYVFCLLMLIGAGALIQGTAYLMQAGIVDSTSPIFNLDSIIQEDSIIGQLLYALFGYESTPTLLQFALYFSFIAINITMLIFRNNSPMFNN